MKKINLKKILATLSVSTFIGGTVIFAHSHINEMVKEERETPNLVLNTDKTYRNITYKSRNDTIPDLKKLAIESNFEESWVYIPSEKKWIETGIDEERCRVHITYPQFNLITMMYEHPVFVHIHPRKAVLPKTRNKLEYIIHNTLEDEPQTFMDSSDIKKETEARARRIFDAYLTIPSAQDVIMINKEKGEVYSPYGVTEFHQKKYFSVRIYKELIKNVKRSLIRNLEFSDTDKSIKEVMKKYVKFLSSGGAEVTFTPYEEILKN